MKSEPDRMAKPYMKLALEAAETPEGDKLSSSRASPDRVTVTETSGLLQPIMHYYYCPEHNIGHCTCSKELTI